MGWPETNLPSTQRVAEGRCCRWRVLSAHCGLCLPHQAASSAQQPGHPPSAVCIMSAPPPTVLAQANFPSSIHWITLSADGPLFSANGLQCAGLSPLLPCWLPGRRQECWPVLPCGRLSRPPLQPGLKCHNILWGALLPSSRVDTWLSSVSSQDPPQGSAWLSCACDRWPGPAVGAGCARFSVRPGLLSPLRGGDSSGV